MLYDDDYIKEPSLELKEKLERKGGLFPFSNAVNKSM